MMKRVGVSLILLLVLGVELPGATSGQANRETPEAVAKAYLEAARAADWVGSAKLLHPDALKQVRGMLGVVVSAATTEKDKSEMQSMLGVRDKAEFDKLSDVDAFARLFRMLTIMSPDLRKILTSSSFEIIGPLQESPDLVHIVYRAHMKIDVPASKPIAMTKLEVMSMRRFQNSWRADLSGDLQGMIQGMAAAVAAKEGK